ncbi:hypothetical protein L7F22_004692 [Adiantum nelumboides]|nr:hypothetical protein [Adiantum nelumboides]
MNRSFFKYAFLAKASKMKNELAIKSTPYSTANCGHDVVDGRRSRWSSRPAATDDAGPAATGAGSLDPQQQLRDSYAKLLKNEGVDEAWRKEFSQQARILVIGRSGVGKTTLIRLVVGKEGPQSISDGIAGVQDINHEFTWSSREEGVPLLIVHDSNGMDVRGQERVDEIKAFLEKHQKSDNFCDHIHIVWYVISAIDPRCVDDGDVMKLISEFKLPLLLIMTHNDYDKHKVSESSLDKLLEGYGTEAERANVKKMMVKVGNDAVSFGKNTELIIDDKKEDTKGLRLVARRTQKLIDKRLRFTWVSAQAVDMDAKLDASATLVASYARRALLTSLPQAIPFADPLKLSIIMYRVSVIMYQIWGVPQKLKEALKEILLMNEGGTQVLRRVGEDILYAAGLAVIITATVATMGWLLPSVLSMMALSGVLKRGEAAPILVKTFSMQVVGTILYAKSTQAGRVSRQRWSPMVGKKEYVKLCEEFVHNAEYQGMLRRFAKEGHSTLDTALRKTKVKGEVKSKMLDIYRSLLHDHRPLNSFPSLTYQRKSDTCSVSCQFDITNSDSDNECSDDDDDDGEHKDFDDLDYEFVEN